VSGSRELARRTGAEIFHGEDLPFAYGQKGGEGDFFAFGDAEIRVLKTPGHTFESLSLVLADRGVSDSPIAVFTGDTLFIGDVGRTDFYPDRAEEVAGLLYDSIFEKLLPLGDHVIVYAAHGAGSVCGSGMASREFSTIGYKRLHNPALRVTERSAFIKRKLVEHHYQPPYSDGEGQSGGTAALARTAEAAAYGSGPVRGGDAAGHDRSRRAQPRSLRRRVHPELAGHPGLDAAKLRRLVPTL
jgi:hydroxyacylglutathione hydrolase